MKVIDILKEASKRHRKHPLIRHNLYRCKNCNMPRYYVADKCPSCEAKQKDVIE